MSAHDELLKIHAILQAPGDCPESTDDDTLTVRMLKNVIHAWHSERRMKPQNSAQTEAMELPYYAHMNTYSDPPMALADAKKMARAWVKANERPNAPYEGPGGFSPGPVE